MVKPQLVAVSVVSKTEKKEHIIFITIAITNRLTRNRYASCQLYDGCSCALGAAMFARGLWKGAGVYNVEQFDPDPFLAELGEQGLPWVEKFDIDLEV